MLKIKGVFAKFPATFWTSNTMELFERWAWYGLFNVLAIYLTDSRDTGALGFSQSEKGYMMGTVSAILYFLPVITGAIADRFGYKKILLISFGILSSGYLMMGYFVHYNALFMVFMFVAIGGALFKPVISATITKTTTSKTSSIGFGIFYMMVNIGALVGPVMASKLRELSWDYVFYMSAAIIFVNIILVLFFYKEPDRTPQQGTFIEAISKVFVNIIQVLKDFRFTLFLLIIVGFWAMYFQLFYTLPVFIAQWMDTSLLYDWLNGISPRMAGFFGTAEGIINPEMLINIDALYIVSLQLVVSAVVMRLKPLNAMIGGIFIAALGMGLTFATRNPFFLFGTLLIFALGEMSSSPKITEYIGKIAPADRVGLYMGCSFLPMSGGNFLAGYLSGDVYGRLSDKFTLLQMEVERRGMTLPAISDEFTRNDYFNAAAERLSMRPTELTTFLWEQYRPGSIWMIFMGIGVATALLLLLYDKLILKKVD